jgi:hypothetical protein
MTGALLGPIPSKPQNTKLKKAQRIPSFNNLVDLLSMSCNFNISKKKPYYTIIIFFVIIEKPHVLLIILCAPTHNTQETLLLLTMAM